MTPSSIISQIREALKADQITMGVVCADLKRRNPGQEQNISELQEAGRRNQLALSALDELEKEVEDFLKAIQLTELMIGSEKSVLIREIQSLKTSLEVAEKVASALRFYHNDKCSGYDECNDPFAHEALQAWNKTEGKK